MIVNQPFPPKQNHYPAAGAQNFSAHKAGTKTAHVVFILDDSGSMQSCRDATIAGFNEFLAGQKASEVPTFISLYKFDGSRTVRVFSRVGVNEVPNLDRELYNPRGGTNLNDAICEVMIEVNNNLAASREDLRDSISLVILTDGEENSSRTYRAGDVKAMVEKAEANDWAFFFLGANIDAFAVGSAYGFGVSNTLQYNTAKMGETMSAATRSVNMMKGARVGGMSVDAAYAVAAYSDDDRKDVI